MAIEKFVVTGDQYRVIDRRMREIKRQIDQENGSPLDPKWIADELQRLIEPNACMGQPGEITLKRKREIIPIDFGPWLADWERFYRKTFGHKYDFSGIVIPETDDIFAWPICLAGDISTEDWLSAGKNPPFNWKWTDKRLDDVIDLSFGRDGWDKQYITRLKANVEADEDLKNLSANQIAGRKINTAGLRERLAIGRFLYWRDKIILDQQAITLCVGSRFDGGRVPVVDWNGGKLLVYWFYPGFAFPLLRSRQAVS